MLFSQLKSNESLSETGFETQTVQYYKFSFQFFVRMNSELSPEQFLNPLHKVQN